MGTIVLRRRMISAKTFVASWEFSKDREFGREVSSGVDVPAMKLKSEKSSSSPSRRSSSSTLPASIRTGIQKDVDV